MQYIHIKEQIYWQWHWVEAYPLFIMSPAEQILPKKLSINLIINLEK